MKPEPIEIVNVLPLKKKVERPVDDQNVFPVVSVKVVEFVPSDTVMTGAVEQEVVACEAADILMIW